MLIEPVRDAYGRVAQEYIARLGSIDATAEADRELIGTWARSVRGPIIDAGCGPGHWTSFLHHAGAEVVGIDPVPAFITDARRRYPDVMFREGRAEDLGVEEAGVSGVLAWYSLIHTDPRQIGAVFSEFARALCPGGSLVVGFFEGAELAAFDHAVTTAYYWPVDVLARVVAKAGFTITETHTRVDPGSRPHGAIIACHDSA